MMISILEVEEVVDAYKSLRKTKRNGNIIDGAAKICADMERICRTEAMREMLSCILSNEDGLGQDITVPSLVKKIRNTLGWEVNTNVYEYIKETAHVEDAVRGQLKCMEHYSCIDIVRRSNAVDDYYLYNVLARNDKNGFYAVWTYNDSLKSLECGRYDLELRKALKLFWDISWY